jgi:hypothetical protein
MHRPGISLEVLVLVFARRVTKPPAQELMEDLVAVRVAGYSAIGLVQIEVPARTL